jgi:hypothetical protein
VRVLSATQNRQRKTVDDVRAPSRARSWFPREFEASCSVRCPARDKCEMTKKERDAFFEKISQRVGMVGKLSETERPHTWAEMNHQSVSLFSHLFLLSLIFASHCLLILSVAVRFNIPRSPCRRLALRCLHSSASLYSVPFPVSSPLHHTYAQMLFHFHFERASDSPSALNGNNRDEQECAADECGMVHAARSQLRQLA